jgi:hypothetical protein
LSIFPWIPSRVDYNYPILGVIESFICYEIHISFEDVVQGERRDVGLMPRFLLMERE